MSNTLVVNLFAAPGCGKSSAMATIFSELKWNNINAEIAPEYAKELVWEGRNKTLDNQLYLFAKQYHRLKRLDGQVDVIITDSPLLLSIIYSKNNNPTFNKLVLETFNSFNNVNFFLKRFKPYNPAGRLQTKEEAIKLDVKIKNLLNNNFIPFDGVDGTKEGAEIIADMIMTQLRAIEIINKM